MNSFKPEKRNVKIIGRTAEVDQTLWMALSGTGIEFTAKASRCSLVICGDSVATGGNENDRSRIAVYVNDVLVIDDMVDFAEKTVDVWKSEQTKEIKVRLIKLTEAPMSAIGIKEILTDAGEIKPTAEKKLKIEFIGDSITCGYGTDDPDGNHHFKTATENVTKAYSFRTSEELDADYSMVSYSGYGIISGYTEGERNTAELVPPFYDKVAFTRGRFDSGFNLTDCLWDFSRFVPDLIIINLGTNDDSFCKGHGDRQKEYQTSYTKFLKTVRSRNPGARILCILGMMGRRLCPFMEAAVVDYVEETRDERISTLWMEEQKAENGYSADFHPSVKSHGLAVEQLVPEIKRIMKR